MKQYLVLYYPEATVYEREGVCLCPSWRSLSEVNKEACPLWYFWYAPFSPTHTHTHTHTLTQFLPPDSVLNSYILYASLVTTGIYCILGFSILYQDAFLSHTHTHTVSEMKPKERWLAVNLIRGHYNENCCTYFQSKSCPLRWIEEVKPSRPIVKQHF